MNKIIDNLFAKYEILSVENFYKFVHRKKIIVFVPFEFIDKLTKAMSGAGAGLIGNYEKCSFRTSGIGTFKPNSKAKPFTGKKNELVYEEEFKLEMECETEKLNDVINAIFRNHPYDETVYEIYDFRKRQKTPVGRTINLKTKIKFSKLIERINKSIKIEKPYQDYEIKKLAVIKSGIDNELFQSAKYMDCECIITKSKSKFNLIKI